MSCPSQTYPECAGRDGLAPPWALPTCIRNKVLSISPSGGFLLHLTPLTNQCLSSSPGVVHLSKTNWEGWLWDRQLIVFATWASQTLLPRNLNQETGLLANAPPEVDLRLLHLRPRIAKVKAKKTPQREWGSHLLEKEGQSTRGVERWVSYYSPQLPRSLVFSDYDLT